MTQRIEALYDRAVQRWLPTWFAAFADARYGGFHEAVDPCWQPVAAPKRLLSQCRQIYVYSHAAIEHPGAAALFLPHLQAAYRFLVRAYHVAETGGWRYCVTPEGVALDNRYDLYAHAFVLLALGFYARASGDPAAQRHAQDTLRFIREHFAAGSGYHEQLDTRGQTLSQVRRQNPHMHLFEACLCTHENIGDAAYLSAADDLYTLFTRVFLPNHRGGLGEFFTADLRQLDSTRGHIVETGHHYEWVWLLYRYGEQRAAIRRVLRRDMRHLYQWAQDHGIDQHRGGIFNTLHRDTGAPQDTHKRIWHVCEGLKAATIMGAADAPWLAWLQQYIDADGRWVEVMSADWLAVSERLPATTPYHIWSALSEARRIRAARDSGWSVVAEVE